MIKLCKGLGGSARISYNKYNNIITTFRKTRGSILRYRAIGEYKKTLLIFKKTCNLKVSDTAPLDTNTVDYNLETLVSQTWEP